MAVLGGSRVDRMGCAALLARSLVRRRTIHHPDVASLAKVAELLDHSIAMAIPTLLTLTICRVHWGSAAPLLSTLPTSIPPSPAGSSRPAATTARSGRRPSRRRARHLGHHRTTQMSEVKWSMQRQQNCRSLLLSASDGSVGTSC